MIRVLTLAVAGVGIAVWTLINTLSVFSVEKAISRDAVDKALHWGSYMSERIPELDDLIETGIPSEAQKEAIRQIRDLGDVFRFKLFDAQGRLVLVSDETSISQPVGLAKEFDPEPIMVAESHEPIVEVYDGSEKPARPDLYSEAYIPLMNGAGITRGVVEVYVDVTQTQTYFEESFEQFGMIVSAASALLFMIPLAGFAVQRRHALKSREDANYLAKYDALTGLMNRSEFLRNAEALHADGRLSSLLFIDADKFKYINDTHGHAIGDEFLAQLGRTLSANTASGDLVARFGGDEFVIGFAEIDAATAERRIRAILNQCAKPVTASGVSITGSVSIGVTDLAPDISVSDALAHADAALYFAKSAGRNQFARYGEDMGEQLRRRIELEGLVRKATDDETFTIDYQPLVAGDDFHVMGYEALLRLKDADGKPVSPEDFIPLAEDMGLIDQIGSWVIHTATRNVAPLLGEPKIAVNLSAVQFRSGELPKIVSEALTASGLPAHRLELEITESLLLGDDPAIVFQIDALREMGVDIAMDDFGTGFSSLSYLWRYGFDRIKIDQSFIAGLEDNYERSLEIIESVVVLGKKLGMNVTAEGVETEKQSLILSQLGCDVLQGYKFGRPAQLPVKLDGADNGQNAA